MNIFFEYEDLRIFFGDQSKTGLVLGVIFRGC